MGLILVRAAVTLRFIVTGSRADEHLSKNNPTIWLLSVATVFSVVSVVSQTRPLTITAVNVVDILDGRILPNSTVTISDQTIVSVTPCGRPPAGAQVVNGQGKFLI